MATSTYTIDSSLKIGGVNTTGNFTETNIPIVLNGSRCLRMRKGSPSSFTELIHKDTTYSNNISVAVVMTGGFSNISHGTDCGDWDNRVDYYFFILTSLSSARGDGSVSNVRWYTDQDIVIYYHDDVTGDVELGRIKAGEHTGSVEVKGSYTCPGWPSSVPSLKIYSVSDNSPFKVRVTVNFNGITYTKDGNWINLGTHDNGGKKIAEAGSYSTSSTREDLYNSNYSYTASQSGREY